MLVTISSRRGVSSRSAVSRTSITREKSRTGERAGSKTDALAPSLGPALQVLIYARFDKRVLGVFV